MDVILGAFAALPGYRAGEAQNTAAASYWRCVVVALGSARAQNSGCTVALITNTDVPEPFNVQLAAAGVEVWSHPFDTFTMPADAPWSLAFYKLCALDWAVREKPFDRYLMLDVDTYTQAPLDDVWREAEEAVLLYQTPHAASQPMAAAISAHYDALEPDGAPHVLTHFGGEFIAGRRDRLRAFLDLCGQIYREMDERDIVPQEGDEAIWCAAAYRALRAGQPVRAANSYVWRYWLGARHYFVATNYLLDPVCVLHLPGAARERQFPLLYRYYTRHGKFPPAAVVHRWCCLPPARPPLLKTLWVRMRAKLL